MNQPFHEDFRRDSDDARPTERSFGLVFTGVFALVGLLPLLKAHEPRWWGLGLAALFLILAFAAPRLLAPLNRLWMAFGKILHRVVSPVVLGALFVLAVVPTALILRLKGSDPLRLKFDKTAPTYWLKRDSGMTSFKNQF